MNGLKYEEWANHYDPDNRELVVLQKHGIDFENKDVLEVGCGTGRFTKRIINLVRTIDCIDPDESSILVLKNNIKSEKMSVFIGTLDDYECIENKYDYIVFPWSFYLIENKDTTITKSKELLKSGGKLIILQADHGEYEEEVSTLYDHYDSIGSYKKTCDELPSLLKSKFTDVQTDQVVTYFIFNNIEQTVDNSIFFVEDEENHVPSLNKILLFKENLKKYKDSTGKIKMSDIVSLYIVGD